jgi:carbonic anhydrase
VIVGHHDCAGNPVSKEQHLKHIKKSVEKIESWNFKVIKVIGLWVNDKWKVEEVV